MDPIQETECTPLERAQQLLRRYHKPLLAVLLLLVYLPIREFASRHAGAGLPAEEAQSATAQVSNQWVGFWQPLAKLMWTVIFYYASGFFSFSGLRTSPVLPDWAKGLYSKVVAAEGEAVATIRDYKAAFLNLTDAERLAHYEKTAWKEMVRFSICLLAACLLV